MFRAIPVSNKYLSEKWFEKKKKKHYSIIKNMKPKVDSSCPYTFRPENQKPKTPSYKVPALRKLEIDRENRILLQKMSKLGSTHTPASRNSSSKSLNRDFRKKQSIQITMENLALLKRIHQSKSCYDTQKWESDRKKHERYLKHMCQYEYKLGTPSSKTMSSCGTEKTLKKPRSGNLPPLSSTSALGKFILIENKNFKVEIQKKQSKIVIVAKEPESGDRFKLMLSVEEAKQILGGDKYENLTDFLSLENGALVLIDPRALPKDPESPKEPLEDSLKKSIKEPKKETTEFKDSEPTKQPTKRKGTKSKTESVTPQPQREQNISYEERKAAKSYSLEFPKIDLENAIREVRQSEDPLSNDSLLQSSSNISIQEDS